MKTEYIAGFFDGEGCFSYLGARHQRRPIANFSQKDRKILELIREELGMGFIVGPTSSGCYQLRISTLTDLRVFIRRLYPHLYVKKKQARVAYSMTRMTTEDREQARLLLTELKTCTR